MEAMNYEAYDALPGIRSSVLQKVETSPKHYKAARDEPPAPDTPSLHFGKLFHMAALEPDSWDSKVALWTGAVRRGHEWDRFKDKHAGLLIANEKEAALCERLRDAIHANPLAHSLLGKNKSEQVVQAVDFETKLPLKARLDSFGTSGLVDLKTCKDASPLGFGRAIAAYRYHAQMAFYLRVLSTTSQVPVYLIALEKVEPFDVVVYRLTIETLIAGDVLVQKWLNTVRECEETGHWPGIQTDPLKPIDAVLPSWALSPDGAAELALTIGGEDIEL